MLHRVTDRLRISLAVSLGLVSFATNGLAQTTPDDFRSLLSASGLTQAELTALDKGDVVVKSLTTGDKQEIATLAVLRLKDLPPVDMNTFRQSLSQKGTDGLKAGGRFSDPPTSGDLQSLELDDDTIEQLKECQPERCDIHLNNSMIRRFQTEIDWNAAEHKTAVTDLFIEILIRRVRDYATTGDEGLGLHQNRRKAIDLAAAHQKLLRDSLFVGELAPEFVDYLKHFPRKELPGVDGGFYWSMIDFGLKPSVTLSHSVAFEQQRPTGSQMFVVSKQFYSSRYVDASLTMSMLVRVSAVDQVETYMIVTDRSRSDALEGALGGLARKIVRNEAEERLKDLMLRTELRLIAATRPSAPVATGDRGIAEIVTEQARRPVVLAISAVLFAAALLIMLRRRGR